MSTDRSLMQLGTTLWATLVLIYVSLAEIIREYPGGPEKGGISMVAADERLREFFTEGASLPEKIRKCMFIFLMTE